MDTDDHEVHRTPQAILDAALERQRLSRSHLAARSGAALSNVTRFFNGQRPQRRTATAYAQAAGFTLFEAFQFLQALGYPLPERWQERPVMSARLPQAGEMERMAARLTALRQATESGTSAGERAIILAACGEMVAGLASWTERYHDPWIAHLLADVEAVGGAMLRDEGAYAAARQALGDASRRLQCTPGVTRTQIATVQVSLGNILVMAARQTDHAGQRVMDTHYTRIAETALRNALEGGEGAIAIEAAYHLANVFAKSQRLSLVDEVLVVGVAHARHLAATHPNAFHEAYLYERWAHIWTRAYVQAHRFLDGGAFARIEAWLAKSESLFPSEPVNAFYRLDIALVRANALLARKRREEGLAVLTDAADIAHMLRLPYQLASLAALLRAHHLPQTALALRP